MKKLLIISAAAVVATTGFSQPVFISVVTDLGLQRSLKEGQQFWAVGHTAQLQCHFTPEESAYVWIAYYSNGKFENHLVANAKSSTTTPQQVAYRNNADMRFKHFSLGWKHYFKGAADLEEGWNLYGYVGFGILLGKVSNSHSASMDTSLYQVPVLSGTADFKRLTWDLGLGWETPIGGALYFYNEARLWVPASDYPSTHLFVNRKAPLVAMLNFGIRVLFD